MTGKEINDAEIRMKCFIFCVNLSNDETVDKHLIATVGFRGWD